VMEIHLVSGMDEVLKTALAGPLVPLTPTPDAADLSDPTEDAITH